MKYNFDEVVNRLGTHAVKWEFVSRGKEFRQWDKTDPSLGSERILPMWVADMDFPCPQPVVEALVERARHGIYGYSAATNRYYVAVISWMERRHGWRIQREWISVCAGVVPALYLLVRAFVSPGEKVIIQRPVYYPFTSAIERNDAALLSNPLIFENGRYRIDLKDLQVKVRDPGVKMLILCNPHNPVGRVWTKDELRDLGDICLENNVLVIADEIHADLLYKGVKFTPFASLGREYQDHSISCTSPSKTFNLAGLQTANIIIPDSKLRHRYEKELERTGHVGQNPFGLEALIAAYSHGEEWLDQVMVYIEDNFHTLQQFVADHLPKVKVISPEGTYLVWLDFRDLGLEKEGLEKLMIDEAKVYLDEGYIFGKEGEGFERINIACPRFILIEALERIKKAVDRLTAA